VFEAHAADATPDEAQVVTNRTRIEEEAAKQKAAQAEAAALAAAALCDRRHEQGSRLVVGVLQAWPWEFYRPGLGPYAPVDGIRDINHVRSKPGQPFGSMKDTPVLLHIKFRSLVEEGLIKHFRFGEAPAPEDLLFALFSMAPK